MTEIILIAAVARNRAIGTNNALPWRLESDVAHFERTTLGHPVVVGRKTLESFSGPLPGRRNLVVTRQQNWSVEGAEIFPDPDSALRAASDSDKVFVIGGAQIYAQTIARASRLIISEVNATVEGDAYFPEIDAAVFEITHCEPHCADADNDHDYVITEYTRRKPL